MPRLISGFQPYWFFFAELLGLIAGWQKTFVHSRNQNTIELSVVSGIRLTIKSRMISSRSSRLRVEYVFDGVMSSVPFCLLASKNFLDAVKIKCSLFSMLELYVVYEQKTFHKGYAL